MARVPAPYKPSWAHVRNHAGAFRVAAEILGRLANGPAEERTAARVADVREVVERSTHMLGVIAAAVAADPKPPKVQPVPTVAEMPDPSVPTLAPCGCEVLHRLAVRTAALSGLTARVGSKRGTVFAAGALGGLLAEAKAVLAVFDAGVAASA